MGRAVSEPCRSDKQTKWSRVAGMGSKSLFLSFSPSPKSKSIGQVRVGGLILCPLIPFFFTLLSCLSFLTFLDIDVRIVEDKEWRINLPSS